MKNFKSLVFASIFTLLGTATLFAQANIATATASATIVQDLAIEKNQDLNFGIVIPGSSATTVILAPATGGVTIGTGLGQILNTASATATSAAEFTVTGSGLSIFTTTLPTSINITNTEASGETMVVDTFLSTADIAGVTLGSVLGELDVTSTFQVGATLNVGANQAAGLYTGTFDVEVNYL